MREIPADEGFRTSATFVQGNGLPAVPAGRGRQYATTLRAHVRHDHFCLVQIFRLAVALLATVLPFHYVLPPWRICPLCGGSYQDP